MNEPIKLYTAVCGSTLRGFNLRSSDLDTVTVWLGDVKTVAGDQAHYELRKLLKYATKNLAHVSYLLSNLLLDVPDGSEESAAKLYDFACGHQYLFYTDHLVYSTLAQVNLNLAAWDLGKGSLKELAHAVQLMEELKLLSTASLSFPTPDSASVRRLRAAEDGRALFERATFLRDGWLAYNYPPPYPTWLAQARLDNWYLTNFGNVV